MKEKNRNSKGRNNEGEIVEIGDKDKDGGRGEGIGDSREQIKQRKEEVSAVYHIIGLHPKILSSIIVKNRILRLEYSKKIENSHGR
jgi:hypothetical protein